MLQLTLFFFIGISSNNSVNIINNIQQTKMGTCSYHNEDKKRQMSKKNKALLNNTTKIKERNDQI